MSTVGEFIEALGGNKAVAEIAGVVPSAVSNWRRAGKVPPRLYLRLAAAARDRDLDVPEDLFREHSDPRRAASEAA